MGRKTRAVTSGIVLVVGAVLFSFLKLEPTPDSRPLASMAPTPAVTSNETPTSQAFGPERVDVSPLANAEEMRQREAAFSTFESMMASLEPRAKADPNAGAVLADAAYICATLDEQSSSPKTPDASTLEYRAWKTRFCGHSRTLEEKEFAPLREFSKTAKLLYNENGWVPGQRDLAIDIILKSTSYRDIQVAADYLGVAGQEKWSLGYDKVENTPLVAKFGELQRVAIETVACNYSGSCEADGLTSMRMCVGKRLCRPGITAFDVWETMYTKQEMAAIIGIQQELISKRSPGLAYLR